VLVLAVTVYSGMVWAFPRSYTRSLAARTDSHSVTGMLRLAINQVGSRVSWDRHVDVELTASNRGGIRFAFRDAWESDDSDTEQSETGADAVVEFRDHVMLCTDNVPIRRMMAVLTGKRERNARLRRFVSSACEVATERINMPSTYRISVDEDSNGAVVWVTPQPSRPDHAVYVSLNNSFQVMTVKHDFEPATP
jgi:hypothetical protein